MVFSLEVRTMSLKFGLHRQCSKNHTACLTLWKRRCNTLFKIANKSSVNGRSVHYNLLEMETVKNSDTV